MDKYKKLNKQPLKFVLAEFRFSPVMQIIEYIPKLQEALRKQYPISINKSEQSIHVQPDGINVSSIDRWSFIDANKTSAVDVNQDRLIYCTAEYSRFEGFSAACKQALDALAKIVDPSLILRIGLRYSDLVKVDEKEKISDLVDSHFASPGCIDSLGNFQHQRNEILLKTECGQLNIRTLYGHHNLSYLPDIQGLPITIAYDETVSERIILDFDHFWETQNEAVSFEVSDILDKLDALHLVSREAFWKITTDNARNIKWF